MRALSTAASAVRHTLGAAMEALLIVAIVAALAVGVALSTGNPAGASAVQAGSAKPWITLNPPTALSVSGTNTATFSIYQTKTTQPWVRVNCTVNGVLAYSQLLGYFPAWPYGEVFTFTSNYLNWNYSNLPLNCVGLLEYKDSNGGEHVLANTTFAVNP